jgi:hypothetical protein
MARMKVNTIREALSIIPIEPSSEHLKPFNTLMEHGQYDLKFSVLSGDRKSQIFLIHSICELKDFFVRLKFDRNQIIRCQVVPPIGRGRFEACEKRL